VKRLSERAEIAEQLDMLEPEWFTTHLVSRRCNHVQMSYGAHLRGEERRRHEAEQKALECEFSWDMYRSLGLFDRRVFTQQAVNLNKMHLKL
jgi:hypothetical protein